MSSQSSSPNQHNDTKKRVSKEKLRTIMEAASALTALGDEESSESRSNSPVGGKHQQQSVKTTTTTKQDKKDDKRFLPDHKKPDAALTFPEKVSPWWVWWVLLHGGRFVFGRYKFYVMCTVSTEQYQWLCTFEYRFSRLIFFFAHSQYRLLLILC